MPASDPILGTLDPGLVPEGLTWTHPLVRFSPGWVGLGWAQGPSGQSLQGYVSPKVNRKEVGRRGQTAGLPTDHIR